MKRQSLGGVKHGFVICVLCFWSLVLIPVCTQAESKAGEALLAIVEAIKSSERQDAIIEYIDWDTAYENLPVQMKSQLKFASSAELKKYYQRLLSDPVSYMREQVDAQLVKMPEEQRQKVSERTEKLISTLKIKLEQSRKDFARSTFELGKVKEVNNEADVEIINTLDGKSEKGTIKLVKVDGKWLLAGLQMVKDPNFKQ